MLSLLHKKHPMLSQIILRQSEFQSVLKKKKKKLNRFMQRSLPGIPKEAKMKTQEQQKLFLSCFSELLRSSHVIAPHCLCLSQRTPCDIQTTSKAHHQCEQNQNPALIMVNASNLGRRVSPHTLVIPLLLMAVQVRAEKLPGCFHHSNCLMEN